MSSYQIFNQIFKSLIGYFDFDHVEVTTLNPTGLRDDQILLDKLLRFVIYAKPTSLREAELVRSLSNVLIERVGVIRFWVYISLVCRVSWTMVSGAVLKTLFAKELPPDAIYSLFQFMRRTTPERYDTLHELITRSAPKTSLLYKEYQISRPEKRRRSMRLSLAKTSRLQFKN